MIFNFSDIFKQNMRNILEAVEKELPKAVANYNDVLNPKNPNRKFFNKNNILDLIRRKKYDRAIKLIKANKVNAFSLFDGVNVFGNNYDRIPFVAAAIALALEKSKNTESMYDKFNRIITELFVPSGINAANMFDAKFTSPNGYGDVLSFILTHDGQINPKKYSEDSDLEILVLLNSLIENGYTFTNCDGMIKYIIENDLISSLKKLVENGIYSANIDDMKRFSISPVSNIGRFISFSAPHPFKFHSPEVEYDDRGKFSGGSMYSPLKNLGYDISKPDKECKVHLSFPFMLRDYIVSALENYSNNGENFSNTTDINFGDGSEFLDSVNMLKYLSSEYGKFIRDRKTSSMDENDRRKYMVDMVKTANDNILRMQNGTNAVLERIGFPKVILVMNNELDADDGKILHKTAPFMKEIWNSVKLLK